jgi:DNA-directed RNA polymerase II subunit RPB1
MVIMLEFGQSAGKEPNLILCLEYGSPSTTGAPSIYVLEERKRVWVIDDGSKTTRDCLRYSLFCNEFITSLACNRLKSFDGDEMNIHLAQSIPARNELKRIANVKYQIIAAKDSNPIIGCVQDAVSGVYMLSQEKKIKGDIVANILATTNSDTQYEIDFDKYYTGLEVFSHIIPSGISIKKSNLVVKNGKIISGVLDKSSVSTQKNSIIHYIWDKYGPTETQDFIDNTQRLVLQYLYNKGYTIGFGDCVIQDEILKQIKTMINSKVLEMKNKITMYENNKENYNFNILESQMAQELGIMQSNIGKMIMDTIDMSNNFYPTIKSKAKGSSDNYSQITGCIGQVFVGDGRIEKKVKGRTIPCYHRDDDTPEARGFIANNLMDGMSITEVFFQSIAGRSSLIDTALKTADTGYVQRKIVKCLEDLIVKYDGHIKGPKENIVQFVYGDNGYDQIKQTNVKLNIITMNNKDVRNNYTFTDSELKKVKGKYSSSDNEKYYKQLIKFRNELRNISFEFTNNYAYVEDTFMSIVNFNRIISEYSNDKENNEIEPSYIIDTIESIINDDDNRIFIKNRGQNRLLQEDELRHKYIYKAILYEYLAPKKIIYEYGLSKKEFDNMVEDIRTSYARGLVEPGEMVGVIAGQSLGEPTSQMTLDSKHHAGAGGDMSQATTGVPRIKELLNYSKSIKTPQMLIHFDEKYRTSRKTVNNIASYLKYITIGEMIDNAEIIYDKFDKSGLSKQLEDDKCSNPFFINNDKVDIKQLPFVFRLELNLAKMMDKETSLLDIKTKFISYWYRYLSNTKNIRKKSLKEIIGLIDKLGIYSNNDNVIHIRFKILDYSVSTLISFLKVILNTITLKGLDNIENLTIKKSKMAIYDKEGDSNVFDEYKVITSGINIESLGLIKGIDFSRCRINDVKEAYKYYGIEAARQVLIDELNIGWKSGGANVNMTHILLLADFMAHIGEIISIDRHGLNKVDVDIFTKATFEKTMEYFTNSCLYNESDKLKTVSSRIVTGRCIPGGTGAFDIILDTEKIKNSEYIDDDSGRTTFIPLEKEALFEDIINMDTGAMDFLVPV